MYVGGLGLTAVARISSDAHGSIVSADLISTAGGTTTSGTEHRAAASLAVETSFADLRPPLESSLKLLPGVTVASLSRNNSRMRLDRQTHMLLLPSIAKDFESSSCEQSVFSHVILPLFVSWSNAMSSLPPTESKRSEEIFGAVQNVNGVAEISAPELL